MSARRKMMVLSICVMVAFGTSGCISAAVEGISLAEEHIAGSGHMTSDEAIIKLPKPATESFMDTARHVGEALGYQVTYISREDKRLSLTKASSDFLIGTSTTLGLQVVLIDPTHLRVNANLTAGAFRQGTQKAVDKKIAEFKEKLLQALQNTPEATASISNASSAAMANTPRAENQ